MLPYREVAFPDKEKPKKCSLFGCSKCRYQMREYKRYQHFRKNLIIKESNPPLNMFYLSIFGMALNLGFAGLMIMQDEHDLAFKGLVGAVAWAVCIFIFDHNAKDK